MFINKYSDEQEDDWYFDLGYQYAYSMSIFIIALVYSISVPLMSVFGCLFFFFKVKHNS